MKIFYVVRGYRLKQYFIVLVAALFSAILLFVQKDQLAVLSTLNSPRAVDSIDTKEKKIALTFDISWGEKQALPILDVLKKNDLKETTFFLSGTWAERHPEIVERIVEDGYEIANHGFQYKNYTELEEEEIKKDIQLAETTLKKLTDKKTSLLRPPSGNINKQVLSIAKQLNYTVIHWSVNSHDWKNPGTKQIVSNVTDNVEGGDIVLLHASDSAKQTAKALPIIIEQLKKQGYQFVTVSELVADTSIENKEIK